MKKALGQHTLSELMPIIKLTAQEFGLKINRAKDFALIRRLIAIRYTI